FARRDSNDLLWTSVESASESCHRDCADGRGAWRVDEAGSLEAHERETGAEGAHRRAGGAGPAEHRDRGAVGCGPSASLALARALHRVEACGHRARPAAWRAADHGRCGAPGGADHAEHARGAHALEHANDGGRVGRQRRQRVSLLAQEWLPHLVRGFKVSRDPQFVEKLEDIVGLYLAPPEHALVLCCDEKSQVQALDRPQPGLPLKKGRAATMTHDYKRNGTTTLFAPHSMCSTGKSSPNA